MVCALAFGVCAAPVPAKVVDIPARKVTKTEPAPQPNSPTNCRGVNVLRFAEYAHATTYTAVVRLAGLTDDRTLTGPPFRDEFRWGPLVVTAPKGSHQFSLSATEFAAECESVRAVLQRTDRLVRMTVNVDLTKRFRKNLREVDTEPLRCELKRGEEHLRLRRPSKAPWLVIRRMGKVQSTEKGSSQPINLLRDRYAGPGTIIETGSDSVVKIAAPNGESVLVGPKMKIRLTRDGLDVLEGPRRIDWPALEPKDRDRFKVRGDCQVIGAQG